MKRKAIHMYPKADPLLTPRKPERTRYGDARLPPTRVAPLSPAAPYERTAPPPAPKNPSRLDTFDTIFCRTPLSGGLERVIAVYFQGRKLKVLMLRNGTALGGMWFRGHEEITPLADAVCRSGDAESHRIALLGDEGAVQIEICAGAGCVSFQRHFADGGLAAKWVLKGSELGALAKAVLALNSPQKR
jgi:hypothetical protein